MRLWRDDWRALCLTMATGGVDRFTFPSGLRLARASWFALAAMVLLLYAVGLPVRLADLSSNIAVQMLGDSPHASAISPDYVAIHITIAESIFGLVLFSIGAFLFWRRSDEGPVLYFSATMVLAALFSTDFMMSLARQSLGWRALIIPLRGLAYVGIVTTYYLFPNGRFVPRWTRPLAAGFVVYALSWLFVPQVMFPSNHLVSTPREFLLLLWAMSWLGSGVVAQVQRFRQEPDPAARQQTKWVLFAFAVMTSGTLITFLPPMVFPELRLPGRALTIYVLISAPAVMLFMAALPLSIAFSALRYRLWNIDAIINRAAVYGALTGILVIVYFGAVVLLQQISSLLTGRSQGSLATVSSTLLIAGLFTPVRRRVQRNIDRRFFRRKYDAVQTLSRFAATARDEVELDRITTELLEVVHYTMQPKHVTLWLAGEGPASTGDDLDRPR